MTFPRWTFLQFPVDGDMADRWTEGLALREESAGVPIYRARTAAHVPLDRATRLALRGVA
jgi:hypothetical protein